MVYLKRFNLILFLSVFISSVGVGSTFPMSDIGDQAKYAFDFVKNVLNFQYMNGDKGEYRTSSALEKITHQPGRAFLTAGVYCGAALLAKKLYDFAQAHGIFDDMTGSARQERVVQARRPQIRPNNNPRPVQRPQQRRPQQRRPQPNQPHRRPAQRPQQRPNVQPNRRPAQRPARGIRIAAPMNGRQLNLLGLGHLNGFYHMQSATPFGGYRSSCGYHSLYNMAKIEADLYGTQVDNAAFMQALAQTPADGRVRIQGQANNRANPLMLRDVVGRRGMFNTEAARLAQNLQISPMTILTNPRAGAARGQSATFRRAQGPCAVHFLCNVPGHWIEISVVKNRRGEQAMYLCDNLNNGARSRDLMQQYVEQIYGVFFA